MHQDTSPNSSQPQQPTTAAPAGSPARTAVVLGLLAALFVGGLALLYALTGGDIQLAGRADIAETTPTAARTQPGPTPIARAVPAEGLATGAELSALQAMLAQAQARITSLTEQSAGFADGLARIDALEADVAAAKAAADAAAERAEAVARSYAALTADYARLGARFTPEGVLIRLDEGALAFPPGSSVLPATAATTLAEIADFLRRHPGQQALLRGHTDASGGADANLRLSAERAAAVRGALVELGVPAERLRTEGVGPAAPIADNASAAGRSKNRRVDILLRRAGPTAG